MEKPHIQSICAGVILFQNSGSLEFLLLKDLWGAWGFPKGHLDGEPIQKAALREVYEETRLSPIIIDDFCEKVEYVHEFPKDFDHKTIYFFLGKVHDDPTIGKEHLEWKWTSPDEAIQLLQFENLKDIIKKCVIMIDTKNQE